MFPTPFECVSQRIKELLNVEGLQIGTNHKPHFRANPRSHTKSRNQPCFGSPDNRHTGSEIAFGLVTVIFSYHQLCFREYV